MSLIVDPQFDIADCKTKIKLLFNILIIICVVHCLQLILYIVINIRYLMFDMASRLAH